LRIGAQILDADEWELAGILAPWTRSLHLWTVRDRDDVRRYHHVPVHPTLGPEEGWIDIPGMLSLFLSQHADCAIVFEPHHAYEPSLAWQQEGMEWVKGIVRHYRDVLVDSR
jgi:hypothetical protein